MRTRLAPSASHDAASGRRFRSNRGRSLRRSDSCASGARRGVARAEKAEEGGRREVALSSVTGYNLLSCGGERLEDEARRGGQRSIEAASPQFPRGDAEYVEGPGAGGQSVSNRGAGGGEGELAGLLGAFSRAASAAPSAD